MKYVTVEDIQKILEKFRNDRGDQNATEEELYNMLTTCDIEREKFLMECKGELEIDSDGFFKWEVKP